MDIKIFFHYISVMLTVSFDVVLYHLLIFLSIPCVSNREPLTLTFVILHISIYEILEKSSHENHDDWTQLQVARAGLGRSCVSLSSSVQPSSSFLFLLSSHPPLCSSFPSTRVSTRSAYVVYKPASFLAGVYPHFPPS